MSWLKTFFSAPDGQGSSKRLKSFILTLLICYMIMSGGVANKIQLWAFWALLVTILLLDAVITVQDITNLRNGNSQAPATDTIKQGDKVEITKVE